ncbi:CBS domain-containing protein CBSCBSPB3 [Carex littledalei]|uniref:CBS domain-containing protein CBSCBSPB3 n=1 Tax=Carex littledalei TaxID=544730 RepID=A0A833QX70_9POAL|nr:CBS domain-containing protein CBSCBSPB3 [Carex littledalei]
MLKRPPSMRNKQPPPLPALPPRKSDRDSIGGAPGRASKPSSPPHPNGERTVKKLQKVKPLTLPEGTTIAETCKRMASRRVDSALITDPNGLLTGIITAEDIVKKVIAEGLRPDLTNVSRAMTKNPVFIMEDAPAIEAMQKMVQGKFRHLPVVENGEVIAIMDITKLLYEAISKMEKVAEQGQAIAAAVEGVEQQLGADTPGTPGSARHAFMENLWEKMFKPSLSTIIPENNVVPSVLSSDSALVAAQKMRDLKVSSVIVMAEDTLQGIITPKDLLARVVNQNLTPEDTPAEKAMTPNPECATLETSILDTLHMMHNMKFLHIPVLDKEGHVAAIIDVLQLTHAAISMAEGNGSSLNEMANTMIHSFWDSTLHTQHHEEEYDTHSDTSMVMAQEAGDGKHHMRMSPPHVNNSFVFKIQDQRGRVHRFSCMSESLEDLVSAVMQRLGLEGEKNTVQLLYEDEEEDKVTLMTDSDLVGAIYHAQCAGLKVLRLHIDDPDLKMKMTFAAQRDISNSQRGWSTFQVGLMTSAIALATCAIVVSLKHSNT